MKRFVAAFTLLLIGLCSLAAAQNRSYTIVHRGEGEALICGHPEFCPEPTQVQIQGCTWGGSMLKMLFLGRGMHLEFEHPLYRKILTSRILDIRAH